MNLLLDTSILIDVLRAYEPATEYVLALDDIPACSEITRVEILRGMRSSERARTGRLFAAISWIEVSEQISRRAGDIGREFRRSYPGLATTDLVIAATALESGRDLATLNVRHFPMFRGLKPPYQA